MSSEGLTRVVPKSLVEVSMRVVPTLPFHQLAKHLISLFFSTFSTFYYFYLLLLYESFFPAARCNRRFELQRSRITANTWPRFPCPTRCKTCGILYKVLRRVRRDDAVDHEHHTTQPMVPSHTSNCGTHYVEPPR